MTADYVVETGKALPMGATLTGRGVNFSLFSRHAKEVTLVIFENAEKDSPYQEIVLDKYKNKSGDVWHCHVNNLSEGACYLYRANGPHFPERGLRFNPNKSLIDPYAKALTSLNDWDIMSCLGYDPTAPSGDLSFSQLDDLYKQPRCIVVNDDFDWQGDLPLNYPLRLSVLYETHIKGLTAHQNSGVVHKGTYRGVIEKIPYLKDLGVTSLEFLPLQEFNEHEFPRHNPRTGKLLVNYWGYSTVAFFAPKGSYSSDSRPGAQVY
ncbi:MAG: glycogen debranching enzyme, partial [Treponema sp.]|nr:glycogen debranching enzyme [Treponema sp.]